jgi:anti-sigma B factor antagonist
MSCKVSVRQAGSVSILDLAGRVALGEGADEVRDAIKKLVQGGARSILVNLQEVSYLDSFGLGELVSAYTSLRSAGGQMKLMHPKSIVKQLLQITNMAALFATYEDEALALQSFMAEAASA